MKSASYDNGGITLRDESKKPAPKMGIKPKIKRIKMKVIK